MSRVPNGPQEPRKRSLKDFVEEDVPEVTKSASDVSRRLQPLARRGRAIVDFVDDLAVVAGRFAVEEDNLTETYQLDPGSASASDVANVLGTLLRDLQDITG